MKFSFFSVGCAVGALAVMFAAFPLRGRFAGWTINSTSSRGQTETESPGESRTASSVGQRRHDGEIEELLKLKLLIEQQLGNYQQDQQQLGNDGTADTNERNNLRKNEGFREVERPNVEAREKPTTPSPKPSKSNNAKERWKPEPLKLQPKHAPMRGLRPKASKERHAPKAVQPAQKQENLSAHQLPLKSEDASPVATRSAPKQEIPRKNFRTGEPGPERFTPISGGSQPTESDPEVPDPRPTNNVKTTTASNPDDEQDNADKVTLKHATSYWARQPLQTARNIVVNHWEDTSALLTTDPERFYSRLIGIIMSTGLTLYVLACLSTLIQRVARHIWNRCLRSTQTSKERDMTKTFKATHMVGYHTSTGQQLKLDYREEDGSGSEVVRAGAGDTRLTVPTTTVSLTPPGQVCYCQSPYFEHGTPVKVDLVRPTAPPSSHEVTVTYNSEEGAVTAVVPYSNLSWKSQGSPEIAPKTGDTRNVRGPSAVITPSKLSFRGELAKKNASAGSAVAGLRKTPNIIPAPAQVIVSISDTGGTGHVAMGRLHSGTLVLLTEIPEKLGLPGDRVPGASLPTTDHSVFTMVGSNGNLKILGGWAGTPPEVVIVTTTWSKTEAWGKGFWTEGEVWETVSEDQWDATVNLVHEKRHQEPPVVPICNGMWATHIPSELLNFVNSSKPSDEDDTARTLIFDSVKVSDPAGMPKKNDDDGETIHVSQLAKVLDIASRNADKRVNDALMGSGEIKALEREISDLKARWGITMTTTDRLYHFLVRHVYRNGAIETPFTADLPEVLSNFLTNAKLPWANNLMQENVNFMVTLRQVAIIGLYELRVTSGVGFKLLDFVPPHPAARIDMHHNRGDLKKLTPGDLLTVNIEKEHDNITDAELIQYVRQIGILLALRTGSRGQSPDTVEGCFNTLAGVLETNLSQGISRIVCLRSLDECIQSQASQLRKLVHDVTGICGSTYLRRDVFLRRIEEHADGEGLRILPTADEYAQATKAFHQLRADTIMNQLVKANSVFTPSETNPKKGGGKEKERKEKEIQLAALRGRVGGLPPVVDSDDTPTTEKEPITLRSNVGTKVSKLLTGSANKPGLIHHIYSKSDRETPPDISETARNLLTAWMRMAPRTKTNQAACWGCLTYVPCIRVSERSKLVHYRHNGVDDKAMTHVVKAMNGEQVAFSLLSGGLNADLVQHLPWELRRGLPKKQVGGDPGTVSNVLAKYCNVQNIPLAEFYADKPTSMSVSEACGQLSRDPMLVPLVEQLATYKPNDADESMCEFNHLLRQVTSSASAEKPQSSWHTHASTPKMFGHMSYTRKGSRSLLVALISDFWLQGNLLNYLKTRVSYPMWGTWLLNHVRKSIETGIDDDMSVEDILRFIVATEGRIKCLEGVVNARDSLMDVASNSEVHLGCRHIGWLGATTQGKPVAYSVGERWFGMAQGLQYTFDVTLTNDEPGLLSVRDRGDMLFGNYTTDRTFGGLTFKNCLFMAVANGLGDVDHFGAKIMDAVDDVAVALKAEFKAAIPLYYPIDLTFPQLLSDDICALLLIPHDLLADNHTQVMLLFAALPIESLRPYRVIVFGCDSSRLTNILIFGRPELLVGDSNGGNLFVLVREGHMVAVTGHECRPVLPEFCPYGTLDAALRAFGVRVQTIPCVGAQLLVDGLRSGALNFGGRQRYRQGPPRCVQCGSAHAGSPPWVDNSGQGTGPVGGRGTSKNGSRKSSHGSISTGHMRARVGQLNRQKTHKFDKTSWEDELPTKSDLSFDELCVNGLRDDDFLYNTFKPRNAPADILTPTLSTVRISTNGARAVMAALWITKSAPAEYEGNWMTLYTAACTACVVVHKMSVVQFVASFQAVKAATSGQTVNLSRLGNDLQEVDVLTRRVLLDIQRHGASLGLTGVFDAGEVTPSRPTLLAADDEDSLLLGREIYKRMKQGQLVLFFDELLNRHAEHSEKLAAVPYFFRDKHTPSGAVAKNDDGTTSKRLIINLSEVTQPGEKAPNKGPTDSVNSAPAGSLNGSVIKNMSQTVSLSTYQEVCRSRIQTFTSAPGLPQLMSTLDVSDAYPKLTVCARHALHLCLAFLRVVTTIDESLLAQEQSEMRDTFNDLHEINQLLTEEDLFGEVRILIIYICGVFGATLMPFLYDNVGTAIQQIHRSYSPCLQLLNGSDHFEEQTYVDDNLLIDQDLGNRHELNRGCMSNSMYLLLGGNALNLKKLTPASTSTSFTGTQHFMAGPSVMDLMAQVHGSKVVKGLEALSSIPMQDLNGRPTKPILLKVLRSLLGVLRYVTRGMTVLQLPLKLMDNLTRRTLGRDQRFALATGSDEDEKTVQWRQFYAGKSLLTTTLQNSNRLNENMMSIALQQRVAELIGVPSLEDRVVVIGSDAAGDGKGGTSGVTFVSNRALRQCVFFNWTDEVVEALHQVFELYGISNDQANAGTIAFKEAFCMPLAVETWGNSMAPCVYYNPQDNDNARSWHNRGKGSNFLACVLILYGLRRLSERRQNWESVRVSSGENVIDDLGSRIYLAENAADSHLLADASISKHMNDFVRVSSPNALVNIVRGALPLLAHGNFQVDEDALESALETLKDVTERSQLDGAPGTQDLNFVGEIICDDPRLLPVAKELAIQYSGLHLHNQERLEGLQKARNIKIRLCSDMGEVSEPLEDGEYIIVVCAATTTKNNDGKSLRSHQLQEGNYFGPLQRSWIRHTISPNSSLNRIRQAQVPTSGDISMFLPPMVRTDQYMPAEQWSWKENDERTASIQPIVVNGAVTTALWSGGTTVNQEQLSGPVGYLLDSRDETLEIKGRTCVRMTKLGKCCLRTLTKRMWDRCQGLAPKQWKPLV